MKVIELLNKIANGEEVPKHIHIRDVDSYTWQKDVKAYWSDRDENNLLSDLDLSSTDLNEEVEIIEEDNKIKKIDIENKAIKVKGTKFYREKDIEIFQKLSMVINEIIDYLEENKND